MGNVTPFLRTKVFEGDEMSTNETYDMLCEVTTSKIYESAHTYSQSIWNSNVLEGYGEGLIQPPAVTLRIEVEITWFLISVLNRGLSTYTVEMGRDPRIRDTVQEDIFSGVAENISSQSFSSTTDLTEVLRWPSRKETSSSVYDQLISRYNDI